MLPGSVGFRTPKRRADFNETWQEYSTVARGVFLTIRG